MIRDSVEKLGFHFADTKILLGSHAHADHMEGDAMVKELTGAKLMAMQEDIPALLKITPGNKPHVVDRILHDGDEVTSRRNDAGGSSHSWAHEGLHHLDA